MLPNVPDIRPQQPLKQGTVHLAATLVMVRDCNPGIEVYMTERPGGIDFAELHVFPGGKVDAADDAWLQEQGSVLLGETEASANQQLGEYAALRYWVAAIRESFEECGVLYARDASGGWLSIAPEDSPRFTELREALIHNELTLSQLCERTGVTLDASGLAYFSHWLTPEVAPRRFDTRFFLARMLPNQATAAHHREVVSGSWVTPQAALEHADAGRWGLISPTRVSLESLLGYRSVDELWPVVQSAQHLPPLTAQLRKEGMCELRGS